MKIRVAGQLVPYSNKAYIPITKEQFITGIMNGERDYRNIRLTNAHFLDDEAQYKAFNEYLFWEADDLKRNPLILCGAEWNFVSAKGICLPFVQAQRGKFMNVDLRRAMLDYGNFERAHFEDVDLIRAARTQTNFKGATFEDTEGLEDIIIPQVKVPHQSLISRSVEKVNNYFFSF